MSKVVVHEADGYKKQVHSGKAEERSKLEMNRINAGTPKTPATKVAPPTSDAKGRNVKAPGNV